MTSLFNIGIVLFLVLGGVIGYFNGIYKSTYKFVFFIILLLIGWLITPIIAHGLMDINLSSSSLEFILYGQRVNKFADIINIILIKYIPKIKSVIYNDSITNNLINNTTYVIIRFSLLIVWLILMATLFKLFMSFILKFIEKRQNRKEIKKKLFYRFGGLTVGLAHSLVLVLIISIPISGICSIGSSIEKNEDLSNIEIGKLLEYKETSTNLDNFMNDYRYTIAGLFSEIMNVEDIPLDEYLFDQIFSLRYQDNDIKIRKELHIYINLYKLIKTKTNNNLSFNSIMSLDEEVITKIFNELEKLESLDIFFPLLFEVLFINSEDLNELEKNKMKAELSKIDYQKEIINFEESLKLIIKLGLFQKNLDVNYYLNLNSEDVKKLCDSLSKLETIKILNPLITNYFTSNHSIRSFLNQNGINYLNIENIKWNEEFKNFGNIYKTYRDLGEIKEQLVNDEKIVYFAIALFNSQLFTNNSIELMSLLFNYLPEDYQKIITIEDLKLEDLSNILNLSKLFIEYGLFEESFNLNDFLIPEVIENVATYISSSQLLSKNANGIIKILLQKFNYINELNISIPENINWYSVEGKVEIKSFLTVLSYLNDIEPENLEKLGNIDTLHDAIINSRLLMYNIDSIIRYLLYNKLSDHQFEIIIPIISWNTIAGRNELRALLKAVSVVSKSNLLNDSDFSKLTNGSSDTNNDGIVDINDENIILEIANSLSSSVIMRMNLRNIIDSFISKTNIEIEVIFFEDYNLWTKNEINSLFNSLKIISSKENLPYDLIKPTDIEINYFLGSKIITDTLINYIINEKDQFNYLVINFSKDDSIWYDSYNKAGELRKLLKAIKIIFKDNDDLTQLKPDLVFNLTDGTKDTNDDGLINDHDSNEIKIILESQIAYDSLIKMIYDMSKGNPNKPSFKLIVNLVETDPRWYSSNDSIGEVNNFIIAFKIILPYIDFTKNSINLNVLKAISTGNTDPADDNLTTIQKSVIVTDTLIFQIKQIAKNGSLQANLVVNIADDDWHDSINGTPGELRNFIRALQIIFKDHDDLNNLKIEPDIILNLTDGTKDTNGDGQINDNDSNELKEILKSKIISDSIIHILIDKYKEQNSSSE